MNHLQYIWDTSPAIKGYGSTINACTMVAAMVAVVVVTDGSLMADSRSIINLSVQPAK